MNVLEKILEEVERTRKSIIDMSDEEPELVDIEDWFDEGDGTMKIKFCPDLTGKEEIKATLIGDGDFIRPILNACIKEKCVAYRNGYCKKYENEVEEY